MEDINHNLNLDTISKTMEDFNLPSPKRIALLERLQAAIGGAPPHFWAACQVCDLSALEKFIQHASINPGMLRCFALQTYTMAYYWGPYPPKAQSQPSTPKKSTPSNLGSSPSTPPTKRQKTSDSPVLLRNQRVRDLAEQRDKFCCVLTGNASVEVAHIYPHHSIKHKEEDTFGQRHMFWDHLRNFWSQEKIDIWKAEIFPDGISEAGVERVYNLITLSVDVHRMWSRGAFALKPVLESDDKKTLEVQFFWQKKQTDTQTMSLLTTPFSTEGLDQNIGVFKEGTAAQLYNFNGKKHIESGDYFKLQTDDPKTKPLPSFQLLEMQWFLQRVLGMAGAADFDWPPLSDSGSDSDYAIEEVPDLGLDDDVEDFSLLSEESLSSPAKPNHPLHPKHVTAEVEGGGDRGSDFVMQHERGY
ncbi:hypothetical protein EG329_012665 [Mollisiaceae sp. DMI_Dod_QoI]|nr:hypothetical protein EG329_012665 [Helotiales sp. DMI_Dod_QoI]